jgi:hypothetical protein
MPRKLLLPFLVTLLLCPIAAQTVSEPPKAKADEKLKEDAVTFLRETVTEVGGLRTAENRISFTSELASLMWFNDEREARSMYTTVVADFKELLAQYDAQMNSYGLTDDEENYRGGLLFMDEPTARAITERRFRTAMAVRQQIAMSMAEHDPDMAYSFYYDTAAIVTNPKFLKNSENQDKYFEFQLINAIADKNTEKALKFAKRSLQKSGFSYQYIDLLKKIYSKDQEKAIDLAESILGKLKDKNLNADDLWSVSSLLSYGAETLEHSRTESNKKAIYSLSELKAIAEMMAQVILSQSGNSERIGTQYLTQIEKYLPARALQIRAKFKMKERSDDDEVSAMVTNTNRAYTGYSNSNTNANTGSMSPREREREESEAAEKRMIDDVMKLGDKKLPKEQRDNIIAQARKIIATTPGRDKKITALSILATQVALAGDRELAAEIMKDARSLINPQPRNYQDFLLSWMLASGYATADPDKAFPLLDDTISRANDTIAAFIKVGEFIDVAEEMIADGELQVGAFGGSMVRDLTRQLGMADATIQQLAKVDFAKTRNLTNRFERPEVRILAKMMVLRAVLGPKQKEDAKPGLETITDEIN